MRDNQPIRNGRMDSYRESERPENKFKRYRSHYEIRQHHGRKKTHLKKYILKSLVIQNKKFDV